MASSRLRIIPELRSVHVARLVDSPGDEVLYFATKFDLETVPESSRFRRVTTRQAAAAVWRSRLDVLEIPETLWLREAPRTWLLAAVWRLSSLRRRRRPFVVSYAIENNDFERLIGGRAAAPALLRGGLTIALRGLHRLFVDRIAFGSRAAESAYACILPSRHRQVETRVFTELPVAVPFEHGCPTQRVVFVGDLSSRKGADLLMRAWEAVETALPTASITLIGSGHLLPLAVSWAAVDPTRRTVTGLVDHGSVPGHLREASVLVAPSRLEGRWKEQIGLPIVDGLAAGLTIVTTRHTGLASWLAERGHHVLADDSSLCTELSTAIVSALRDPLPRDEVWASLPTEAGRAMADRWLGEVAS